MYNTLQEIFDASYVGLMKQGFRQAITGPSCSSACRYKSEQGLKCAVGHLIDDSKYVPEIEGTTLAVMLSYDKGANFIHAVLGDWFTPECYSLLIDLQNAHDNSPIPLDMKVRLGLVADKHGLKVPSQPE